VDLFGIHLPSLAGAAATFAAVYTAFSKFDGDQSDDNRKFVRDWLLGLKVDEKDWKRFFEELFTNLFGSRHFSTKCVRQSLLLSVVLVGTLWLFWSLRFGIPVNNSLVSFVVVFMT
jgi:hypothetical protein